MSRIYKAVISFMLFSFGFIIGKKSSILKQKSNKFNGEKLEKLKKKNEKLIYKEYSNYLETINHLLEMHKHINVQILDRFKKKFQSNTLDIWDAAYKGCLPAVEYYVKQDYKFVNMKDSNHLTPIYYAAQQGHVLIVKHLISRYARFDVVDYLGFTPLQSACFHGHFFVVDLLLTVGANVNHANLLNMTALHYAVWRENVEVVKRLIKANANQMHKNFENCSPLDIARELNSVEIILYLETHIFYSCSCNGKKALRFSDLTQNLIVWSEETHG